MDSIPRNEENARELSFWGNFTNYLGGAGDDDTDDSIASQYVPPKDVSVDQVITALYLNMFAFVFLMATYEVLRRLLPAVYSSRVKRRYKTGVAQQELEVEASDSHYKHASDAKDKHIEKTSLPIVSWNWVSTVFSVSWNTVRKEAGLDGYFFLRYIRMNLRICAVTTLWAFLILVPIYATGINQNGQDGWYHWSISNVAKGSWRLWVPSVFAYFFSGFIVFVMKQEYRHFLQLRMDFLAKGSSHVHPQHHYSLLVENIPHELRSEKALYDYFDKLFPGMVHSASIVLNLPDLEYVKSRCLRVCRRLEKSIAHYHATGSRPTHNVGSPRIQVLGVDTAPFDWSCGAYPDVTYVDDRIGNQEKPSRGTHVDSISYYTHDLATCNKDMYSMQQRKSEIALSGNSLREAENWFGRLMVSAYEVADQIMVDSAEDNALRATYSSFDDYGMGIPQAENMSSHYGSFGPRVGMSPRMAQSAKADFTPTLHRHTEGDMTDFSHPSPLPHGINSSSREKLLEKRKKQMDTPGKTDHGNWLRRVAGRIGLDFVVAGVKFANRQLDSAMEGVVGATMSSTGFVTFLSLTSVTCAATTPLTSKPQTLEVCVAPEPQDIIWENAHVSAKSRKRSERTVNIFLVIGVFFWIFPLTLIQLFANTGSIAKIPGLEWIESTKASSFVNGYLPVVALLLLILILPVAFELLARRYERRTTISGVQRSMMGRYFFYQVFNIYITVTAGTLWRSLADILDHPSSLLSILGEKLPSMVGYFIALLTTKILAGLPVVFLRLGALSRMILLRAISSGKKLTQRELDQIYRQENVQYGWEFPSQLLVVMIVFTYAVICPIIIPVGLVYFCGSLLVYKKQVLFVYQPVYESGGSFFPTALQRTLFGLACGQLTLIGYLLTRGCYFQPIFLIPLPITTIFSMGYFNEHYAIPANRLSLERAREFDRMSEWLASNHASRRDLFASSSKKNAPAETMSDYGVEARRRQFDKNSYRQPVLTQKPMTPRPYRRGQEDELVDECKVKLRELQDYMLMTGGSVINPSTSVDTIGSAIPLN